jgi:ubiquinone/menaquinone biosynthesis C-methylase UbiE
MFEQFWGPEKEEFSDRDPDTLVGWPENYPFVSDCHKVLDIGCGIGNVVEWLTKRGHEAYGLTCQEKEMEKARQLGRYVALGDMHNIPLPDSITEFDAFTMWDSLEHSIAPLAALMEAKRVTRNGGKGMIFIPGQNWVDYFTHIIVPTQAQMKHLLKQAGLNLVEIVDMSWNGTAPEQAVYKIVVEK